ncbi:MAG: polysaccharide deacetylase family protein [Mobilicoccus sp.]|nr:polysaccharide deacetylase family protein [Mobilicoccus sp.]
MFKSRLIAMLAALTLTLTLVGSPAAQAAPRVNCAVAKCVALTFDDGPGPYTPRLLDTLKRTSTKATFFVLGNATTARPATVKRAAREGHVIGNHGWDHRQFTRLSAAAQRDQVRRTASAIVKAGATAPRLVRPPYGSFNKATRALGAPLVLWDVDPLDWKYRSVSSVTTRVMQGVRPGSIVLLHDVHGTTVDAVPGIIAQLKAKGYTLVTVPELLRSQKAGQVYFRR